jgi:hypothetical protein
VSLADQYRIAAIVPCYNEEAAVAKVVTDLRASVPGMTVYVYDNRSTDRTVERAREAGAVVRSEPLKGKGNVVRRAFADIDADIYLLIDGDDTYDASAAPIMIEKLVSQNLDHVLGVRKDVQTSDGPSAYRPAHETGNRVLNRIVCAIFGDTLGDMLSGYRVFSRRFVKSFPAVSREFEIETELTVHSLALRIPSTSVPVNFRDRAAGSESKLRTYRDGWKILHVIVNLARHERPITFFGVFALLTTTVAVILGVPVVTTYFETSMVPRFPTLFVSSFLLVISCLAMVAGLVMDGIRKARHEHSRLAYMRYPAVSILEPQTHAAAPYIPAMRHGDMPARVGTRVTPGSASPFPG